jgi:uncharacterized integral membrane protein
MQPLKIIILLIIIALVAVFTFQNTQVVQIMLYFWTFELSVSLLLLATLMVGVLCGMLLMLLNSMLSSRRKNAVKADHISSNGKDSLWDS